jgi:hypothetical protein
MMSEITQADIEKAISECYWRKEVAKVSFCAANCIPCEIVINSGKCEALRELVNKAAEQEGKQ